MRWPFRKVKKIDMLIKQLEEEKEKIVSSSSVSGKEEELPRGLKEQQGEERGGNFVVVGAPTRKVILEDIENRLQEMLKMRDELYADPNSNIHLLPNSSGSAINSGGGGLTAEKRGESNNTRSPSRQQAKAAKAAAAANAGINGYQADSQAVRKAASDGAVNPLVLALAEPITDIW